MLINEANKDMNEENKKRRKEIDDEIYKQLKEKVNCYKINNLPYNHKELRKQVSEKVYEEWALRTALENPTLAKQVGFRAEYYNQQ